MTPHPPSWPDPRPPLPNAACSCCKGRRWWSDLRSPRDGGSPGWCCAGCHPPVHLGADERIERRTTQDMPLPADPVGRQGIFEDRALPMVQGVQKTPPRPGKSPDMRTPAMLKLIDAAMATRRTA